MNTNFPCIKKFRFELVNPRPEDSIKNHLPWFDFCTQEYNKRCMESTVNRKQLHVEEYGDKYIVAELHSEVELQKSPGKALILLSKLLISQPASEEQEYDPFFENCLFHNKLFTVTSLVSEDENEISDADVVKALIDYLVLPKSTMAESKKKAFADIKTIVKNSGLLSAERGE